MPGPATRPLFDEAKRLGIGFCLGYAELTEPDADGVRHRYNSQVLVERDGSIVATYRKVHLPGHEKDEPDRPFQHAERHYFEPGPDEFGVCERLRRAGRDDDLQRPPLAGVVPGDGPAGRRADPVRLQHPDPLRPRPEPGHPPGLPQRPRDAVRRLPERHVGRRRRQGRRRGGRRLAGAEHDRRPVRADRRPGADRRRRADHRRLRPRLVQALHPHAVRLRPLPPPGDVHPHHVTARRRHGARRQAGAARAAINTSRSSGVNASFWASSVSLVDHRPPTSSPQPRSSGPALRCSDTTRLGVLCAESWRGSGRHGSLCGCRCRPVRRGSNVGVDSGLP